MYNGKIKYYNDKRTDNYWFATNDFIIKINLNDIENNKYSYRISPVVHIGHRSFGTSIITVQDSVELDASKDIEAVVTDLINNLYDLPYKQMYQNLNFKNSYDLTSPNTKLIIETSYGRFVMDLVDIGKYDRYKHNHTVALFTGKNSKDHSPIKMNVRLYSIDTWSALKKDNSSIAS